MSVPRWHKPSDDDGDTHYGVVASDGWVTARCGIVFRPIEDLFIPGASLATAINKRCGICGDPPGSPRSQDAERVHDVMSALGSGQRATRKQPRRHRRS